jgi:hypothetical protein
MKVKTWKVRSHSNGDEHYYVSLWDNGMVTCTCPHFVHRLAGTAGVCKHIDDALDGRFIDETVHIEQTPVQKVVSKARRAVAKMVLG